MGTVELLLIHNLPFEIGNQITLVKTLHELGYEALKVEHVEKLQSQSSVLIQQVQVKCDEYRVFLCE